MGPDGARIDGCAFDDDPTIGGDDPGGGFDEHLALPHRRLTWVASTGTPPSVKPVARNAAAIQVFHDLGFRTLGHVQLFMSLERDTAYWRPGPELHGRAFDC